MSLRSRALRTVRPAAAVLVTGVAVPLPASAQQAAPPPGALAVIGRWEARDRADGPGISWMQVERVEDGSVVGRLLRPMRGYPADARCTKCDGPLTNAPMTGMAIAYDMRWDGDHWEGRVRDARNGRTYRGILRMRVDTLEMRGYLGPFGQSQRWYRLVGAPPAP